MFQVLVIAYVGSSDRPAAGPRRKLVAVLLVVSAMCYATSLAFGYLAKGAVIIAVREVTSGKPWTFPSDTEFMNVWQFVALAFGLFIFLITFLIDRRFLSRAVKAVTG